MNFYWYTQFGGEFWLWGHSLQHSDSVTCYLLDSARTLPKSTVSRIDMTIAVAIGKSTKARSALCPERCSFLTEMDSWAQAFFIFISTYTLNGEKEGAEGEWKFERRYDLFAQDYVRTYSLPYSLLCRQNYKLPRECGAGGSTWKMVISSCIQVARNNLQRNIQGDKRG